MVGRAHPTSSTATAWFCFHYTQQLACGTALGRRVGTADQKQAYELCSHPPLAQIEHHFIIYQFSVNGVTRREFTGQNFLRQRVLDHLCDRAL